MQVKEAAERLGRTPDAVIKMIKRGALKAKRFGSVWVVNANSVAAYERIIAGRVARREERLNKGKKA